MAQNPQIRQALKQFFPTITEAELDKVGPNIERVLARFPEYQKYKIIAEVTEAKFCSAGIQPGQKVVFSAAPPVILTQETTCPTCLRALGPLTGFINTIMERIAEGIDPNPGVFQVAECLDPGIERGGLGKVVFRVYAQKIA